MGRLFGTDGIRGVANEEPLTTELTFRLGRQLVATLLEHHGTAKVRLVVGRDTRLSGPMLEGALVSGALSAGADVFDLSSSMGPLGPLCRPRGVKSIVAQSTSCEKKSEHR